MAVLSVLSLNAYGEEPVVMEQLTSNGQVKMQLLWPEVEPDKIYGIRINFLDPNTDGLLENVEINFAIAVIQHGSLIESYEHLHTDKGNMDFVVMFPEDGILPVGLVRFTLVAVIIITAFSMLKEQFSQRKESKKPKE